MGHIGPAIPTDNVYVIATADDLPQELSQWTLYHLLYDPGAGIGLYYSPDGLALTRLASGGGGGGVTSFEGRAGIVTAIAADYAGFYVDSFAGRTGVVTPLVADYAGLYVDSFEGRVGSVVAQAPDYAGLYVDSFIGRVGPVVAIEADYDAFYLVKGAFASQTVLGDVLFTGDIEFINVQGIKFGPSTELELRNPGDDSTWFLQYTAFFCEFGVFGTDFQDIAFNFSNSFTEFRFGAPILVQERATAVNGPSTHGQLWVRNDNPNILMFTDGDDTDWIVTVTAA